MSGTDTRDMVRLMAVAREAVARTGRGVTCGSLAARLKWSLPRVRAARAQLLADGVLIAWERAKATRGDDAHPGGSGGSGGVLSVVPHDAEVLVRLEDVRRAVAVETANHDAVGKVVAMVAALTQERSVR